MCGGIVENSWENDIIRIEEQIDKAIENEDYEELDRLLELRGTLLGRLPLEMLREIYERDQLRQERLRRKIQDLKMLAHQLEASKKLASSQSQDDKGTYLDSGA